MTLEELKAKLPPQFAPWVDAYGPSFLAMSVAEIKAWIDLLVKGDIFAAYTKVLEGQDNSALLDEWTAITAEWQTSNVTNWEKLEAQKAGVAALVKILLVIALAAAGF